MITVKNDQELRELQGADLAFQTGPAGGFWMKETEECQENGGTVLASIDGAFWVRQCDPARVDARWFGVRADGVHDDAPALQAAIDSLPQAGGKVLLPVGRMLCRSPLRISRSYFSLEGVNCGLLSKYFEPGGNIGQGSLLCFEGCNGIIIQPPAKEEGATARPPRLGGITLRDLGLAGSGRQEGQTGILVKRGENWGWGSTDALMLERVYCIDLLWSAEFDCCDMSVLTGCWFSECGNGIRLSSCVYNCITNCCFADNDGIGVELVKGKGSELCGNVFMRNDCGLRVDQAQELRVIGGIIGTDAGGGPRKDQHLIQCMGDSQISVTGTDFSSRKQGLRTAVTAALPQSLYGCRLSGELEEFQSSGLGG